MLSIDVDRPLFNATSVFAEVWVACANGRKACDVLTTLNFARGGVPTRANVSMCGANDRGDKYSEIDAVVRGELAKTMARHDKVPFRIVYSEGGVTVHAFDAYVCVLKGSQPDFICVDLYARERAEKYNGTTARETTRRRASCSMPIKPALGAPNRTFSAPLIAYCDLPIAYQRKMFVSPSASVDISTEEFKRGTCTVACTDDKFSACVAPIDIAAHDAVCRAESLKYSATLARWVGARPAWAKLAAAFGVLDPARMLKQVAMLGGQPRWYCARTTFWVNGAAMMLPEFAEFRATEQWIETQMRVGERVTLAGDDATKHPRAYARALAAYANGREYVHDYRMTREGPDGFAATDVTTRIQIQEAADCEDLALFAHDFAAHMHVAEFKSPYLQKIQHVARQYVPFLCYGAYHVEPYYTETHARARDDDTEHWSHAFTLMVHRDVVQWWLRQRPDAPQLSDPDFDAVYMVDGVVQELATIISPAAATSAADDIWPRLNRAINESDAMGCVMVPHRETFAPTMCGDLRVRDVSMHDLVATMVSRVPSALGMVEGASYLFQLRKGDDRGATMRQIACEWRDLELSVGPAIPKTYVDALRVGAVLERPMPTLMTNAAKRAAKISLARRALRAVMPERKCDAEPHECTRKNVYVDVDWFLSNGRYPTYDETCDARAVKTLKSIFQSFECHVVDVDAHVGRLARVEICFHR